MLLLLFLLGSLYWALAPAVINGDGIGYLKQIQGSKLAPGHLAYLPLLRLVAQIWPHQRLLDLVPPFRALSLICSLITLALVYSMARQALSRQPALLVTALLGLSHSFLRSATEVEAYAPALTCAVASLWAARRSSVRDGLQWAPLFAGLCAGIALHLHLTLALLVFPLVCLLWRLKPGHRALALATALGGMGAAALIHLALVMRHLGHTDISTALTWLHAADHGVPYPRPWLAPLTALWGICRSLVHAPYPYQAPVLLVAGLTVVGAAAWIALLLLRRTSTAPPALEGRALLCWCLPFVGFALAFFPSDTERWLFIMPALVLYLGPFTGPGPLRWKAVPAWLAVVAVVALANLGSYHLPAALDRGPLDRAAAVDQYLHPGDLLISPGHGWDELIGLSARRSAQHFILVYETGAARSLPRAIKSMHWAIRRQLRTGGRVLVARLQGHKQDRRGFSELGWFGLSPAGFEGLFASYRPRATTVPGLWLLAGLQPPPDQQDTPQQ